MKKCLFLAFVTLLIFFSFSCPQELTKGTVWEGEIKGDFGNLAEDSTNDFEVYFKTDNTCKAYITYSDDTAITLEGEYTLTNNYLLTAELKGEADVGGNNDTKFKLELDGSLNYYSGYGTGEYKMKISGGSIYDDTYEDDWDLTKVGS